jgi:superfamily II DNA or RNA helicase
MELRPRQKTFVESVEKGWKDYDKQLGVAPTGCGKTIMFSHLAKRQLESTGGRTLILAHREELIDQAIDKLHAATGIRADKEKAEFRASRTSPVVVASIQTMMRRFDQWPADHFELVVCDEAHHSLSDSWKKVLQYFDPHAKILGVTATPDRGDKRELGEYYQNIAHEISLLDLIKEKFLSQITIRSIPLEIDLDRVSQTAGDFDSAELGGALDPYLGQIADSIKEFAPNRKTLCFLPLIATSKKFTEICVERGLNARHIDGESEDRKET